MGYLVAGITGLMVPCGTLYGLYRVKSSTPAELKELSSRYFAENTFSATSSNRCLHVGLRYMEAGAFVGGLPSIAGVLYAIFKKKLPPVPHVPEGHPAAHRNLAIAFSTVVGGSVGGFAGFLAGSLPCGLEGMNDNLRKERKAKEAQRKAPKQAEEKPQTDAQASPVAKTSSNNA